MVSKCFGGEDLSEGHSIGVLNLLPHVYQHHTLGVDQPEACECTQGHKLHMWVLNQKNN